MSGGAVPPSAVAQEPRQGRQAPALGHAGVHRQGGFQGAAPGRCDHRAPSRHEATKASCSATMLSCSVQLSSSRRLPVPGSGRPRPLPIITSLRSTKFGRKIALLEQPHLALALQADAAGGDVGHAAVFEEMRALAISSCR